MVVSHRAILNRKVQMWLSEYQYKPFCTFSYYIPLKCVKYNILVVLSSCML